ncbi:MAG: VOC family protein [Solirubrobacterales bacterium]
MDLEGIHHVTCITADAPANRDFYVRVLGMRMVKKTVNQDDPSVYHLFYADDGGSAGADITFFEYPNAVRGDDGAGMVHRTLMRVASEQSLDFWSERLAGEDVEVQRPSADRIEFADPEGLGLALVVDSPSDAALSATSPEIPAGHALRGFAGVEAMTPDPAADAAILVSLLGFERVESAWEARGQRRGGTVAYGRTDTPGRPGAGTVHHVAWASADDDHESWQRRLAEAGVEVTPVIDRFYFRSIYFRMPSGVLFEIATMSPGFATDEDADALGQRLSLPPKFEPWRERIESVLTPLPG